jgi:hypothetical protein
MNAEEAYEKEQSSFAQDAEDGDGQRIDLPVEPEVRPEVYKDVEPLIFQGFLTVAAEINGVDFVFKSLNQHEMRMLSFMHPGTKKRSTFWDSFLAYGVFMVDGQNILPDRERYLSKVAELFASMTPELKNKVIWHLSEVNRRASNAVALTECYVTEKYSRYRWYQLQGLDMTTTAVTGLLGTERLGLNWAQLIWRAVNRIEDLNHLQEQEWEHAKFVGSCMAGKGISKVYSQDNERRRKEKEEQIARKDKVFRKVLFGEELKEGDQTAGAIKIMAKTAEELQEQMEKALRGEKDQHDLVVEAYENQIRQGYLRKQQQMAAISEEREKEFGGKSLLGGSNMTGMTLEQVKKMLAEQHAGSAGHSEHDQKLQGVVDRYIVNGPEGRPVIPMAPMRRGSDKR